MLSLAVSRIKSLFQLLCEDLKPHMLKEEQVLFPYIIRLEEAASRNQRPLPPPFGTVRNPVRMMMLEHDRAGELLRELREVSSHYTAPADACISYRTLYQALEAFEQHRAAALRLGRERELAALGRVLISLADDYGDGGTCDGGDSRRVAIAALDEAAVIVAVRARVS